MNSIYVLLMLWATSSSYGGVTIVNQEFSSLRACEDARVVLAGAHDGRTASLRAQGCFKKW